MSSETKKKEDRDTALRYLAMLACIPMQPAQVSTKFIHEKLTDQGYLVDVRTIQRNLADLSTKFPLVCTEQGKSYLWSFKKGTTSQWPALNMDAALGVLLVENNLREQLPSGVVQSLEPLVGQARATLDALDKSGFKKVMDKHLRIVPRHLQLQKAEINPEVINRVMESLQRKRQLEITFRGNEYVVNPLGIVVRGAVSYLVCTFDGHEVDEYRTPALHRITSANVQARDVVIPSGFDLDEVIASGRLQWVLDDKIQKFELAVYEDMVGILEETPINDTQVIRPYKDKDDEGWFCVTFEAPYTMELRHWLMSMCDNIIVNKPAKIRKEFREMAMMMVEYYE